MHESPSPDLAFAFRLADVADAIAIALFRSKTLAVEQKPDLTPVTEADRAIEHELRGLLSEERPDDAVLGEELGETGDHTRRWILDPIDGTRNYARGIPLWATLVALEDDGEIALGVVSAPALGRRWWAERAAGAHANGERIHVSRVDRVSNAVLSFALDYALPAIAHEAWHARGFGDFWAHMLVAEGSVDGVVEGVGVAEWDLAAVQVIVEEAGGRFSDFTGEARRDQGTCITSNGRLHDALLQAVVGREHLGGPRAG